MNSRMTDRRSFLMGAAALAGAGYFAGGLGSLPLRAAEAQAREIPRLPPVGQFDLLFRERAHRERRGVGFLGPAPQGGQRQVEQGQHFVLLHNYRHFTPVLNYTSRCEFAS